MWKIKLFLTESWYRQNLVENIKYRFDRRWRIFNSRTWMIQPNERGKMVRLGPNLYTLVIRIKHFVVLKPFGY